MGGSPSYSVLEGWQIKLTNDYLARGNKNRFNYIYKHQNSQRNMAQEGVRIWGLHTIFIGDRPGQGHFWGGANNFLEGEYGERLLMEKQMTFWIDK